MNYKNNKKKSFFNRNQLKDSTGVRYGLHLCGGEDEINIINKLSHYFRITFSKDGVFKTTNYIIDFLQPGKEFREYYNLYNEVLLLFSPYDEFENRTLDFVDKTLNDYENRLDKVCIFLVSKDESIETKINLLNENNKDSRIIIPFTYGEILKKEISKATITNKLRKYFYNRDLFALESPLKTEAYFYGRNKLIQELYDKYKLGEHAGLFGLRKTGKTSVLYALERQLVIRKGYSIYIDCQSPGIYMLRWNELLKQIISDISDKYCLKMKLSNDNYTETKAALSFGKDINEISQRLKTRILFMFDEIEHICFQTSDTEWWREGQDYCRFWQTLRSTFQKNSTCFTFLIAGVNPSCIETAYIQDYIENPIFSMLEMQYLKLFDLSNVKDMISHIGKYMGLKFDEEIYTKLLEDYGGHPFLIRHICSLINKNTSMDRPCQVSKYEYQIKKNEYDVKIVSYVEMVLGVLQKWYPNEYKLLEILATNGTKELKNHLQFREKEIQHLIGYGIVKMVKGDYFITINAVNIYLQNNSKILIKNLSTEEAWMCVGKRRNALELKLRKTVLTSLTITFGNKNLKAKLLEVVDSHRKEKEKLADLEIDDILNNHFYLLDLKNLVVKHWEIYKLLFNDKTKFELCMETINRNRIDAHAKTISESEMFLLDVSFRWLEEQMVNLPNG